MRDVEGKVAFITGGASGVGFGMARAFLEAGMKVVIADVRQEALDRAMAQLGHAGAGVHAIRLDVTDRDAMTRAADETERLFGRIHVICNNAGINLFNDMAAATYQDWDWVLGVNLGGVINGVVTFVPRIRAHGEGGHVINTASMASFISGPGAGIYTCSKFAVRGLSEALRWALMPLGIGVSVVCPGLVNSEIYQSERIRPAHLSTDATSTPAPFVTWLEEVHQYGMTPEEIGRKILRGLRRNDLYIFTHPEFREELREIFDEVLTALPDEPAPPQRLKVEEGRRARKAEARAQWPKDR